MEFDNCQIKRRSNRGQRKTVAGATVTTRYRFASGGLALLPRGDFAATVGFRPLVCSAAALVRRTARLITIGELDAGGSKARYGNDRGSERRWR
jgi:hypothetical protein